MSRHLLVTNDFAPKVGGIQSYLWELWRRLPAEEVTVYTTPHDGAAAFDAAQPFEVIRSREPWLVPGPHLVRQVNRIAKSRGLALAVIDPALPAGLIGRRLDLPYAVIVHGAEAAIPARLALTRPLLRSVLSHAAGVIAAGGYPAEECARVVRGSLPFHLIPPGVDGARFAVLEGAARAQARLELGLHPDAPTVVSVSRLVPRKGMDTLVRAAARIAASRRDLQVVIAGDGRDRRRLRGLIERLDAPVRLLGRVDDEAVTALIACADVFAMLCRARWRGLEQEGFGIVFLEAAACGVPQVAGFSGGAHEAVADGETGLVVRGGAVEEAAEAIDALLSDTPRRAAMGVASRERALTEFSYDGLARRLRSAIAQMCAS